MDVTDAVAAGRQPAVGLPDLVRVPLRRWSTLLAVTVLVIVAGVGFLLLVPARYTATSVVVVRPVVIDPFTYPSGGADRAVNMTAENGVANSNEVIDRTAAATGRTTDEVRTRLQIETPVGGQVLRFAFAGGSAQEAVAGANTAATTYLQVRAAGYENQRAALLKSYDGTIALITAQRRAAQKALPATLSLNTSSPAAQAVLDQVRALSEQLVQLNQQRVRIAVADLSPGTVTGAAREPVPSSHDGAPLYLLAAALGGLLLGALAAYTREAFDRRVRSTAQAGDLTGLPVLGVVRARGRRGAAGTDGDYRYVALAVAGWIDRRPAGPLVVLASRGDEGGTQVAAGLAVALAETGCDVYLGGVAGSLDELRDVLRAAQRRRPAPVRRAPSPGNPVTVAQQRSLANGHAKGAPPVDATQEIIGLTFASVVDTAGHAGAGVVDTAGHAGASVDRVERPGNGYRPAPAAREPAAVGVPESVAAAQSTAVGTVRLGPFERQPAGNLAVIDAPPADTDERGVRAARSGAAVLVVALDRTRNTELVRLTDRIRAAGVEAIGVVVTGGRGG